MQTECYGNSFYLWSKIEKICDEDKKVNYYEIFGVWIYLAKGLSGQELMCPAVVWLPRAAVSKVKRKTGLQKN